MELHSKRVLGGSALVRIAASRASPTSTTPICVSGAHRSTVKYSIVTIANRLADAVVELGSDPDRRSHAEGNSVRPSSPPHSSGRPDLATVLRRFARGRWRMAAGENQILDPATYAEDNIDHVANLPSHRGRYSSSALPCPTLPHAASLQAAMRRARSTSSGQHFPRPDSSTSPVRIHRETAVEQVHLHAVEQVEAQLPWYGVPAQHPFEPSRRGVSGRLSSVDIGARPLAESEVGPSDVRVGALSTASSHQRHHA